MIDIRHGDCLEVLRAMPDGSVDAVVTDPPYGLSFMGKKWDYDVPSVEIWQECLRVLKPGGHLLAFAGTRTQHRMAVRIEDAGFEIRDMIAWVYGSGFPKSHNLSGDWQGWGTALKPALEPITVARKPLVGTVAENVLMHGTGALNVDGCRVAAAPDDNQSAKRRETARRTGNSPTRPGEYGDGHAYVSRTTPERYMAPRAGEMLGRWPANLIHDGSDEVVGLFPDAGGGYGVRGGRAGATVGEFGMGATMETVGFGDSGSAARFFYCAKASKADRDEGLEFTVSGRHALTGFNVTTQHTRANHHPTVKPTDLMRYLCRLVTPPGGVVLDPFCGSGSTGKAAVLEGFRFIGIERDPQYLEIARARVAASRREPEQVALI